MTISFTAAAGLAPPPGFLLGMAVEEVFFHLAVISGAALVLWLGVSWVDRLRLHWSLNSQTPKALFRELCRAHRLSRTDRQFLAAIAELSPAAECCRVFIDRRVLDDFAGANPAEFDHCRRLAGRLFGERRM